ncbi:hypothetical protein ACN28E_40580 [Archangium lansingense]|uniref:hypothetical protein n=1 Tax=Archangium lansingense TaxID=2995310 RepID=UPI003B81A1A9
MSLKPSAPCRHYSPRSYTSAVDLPDSAVDAFKGHRHLRGPYVFCQEDGQPLTAGMTEHRLARALSRAGSPKQENEPAILHARPQLRTL